MASSELESTICRPVDLADISATDNQEVQTVPFHPDVLVAESNRRLGNMDPRFGDTLSVIRNRLQLAGYVGCKELVVMVAQISDSFVELDAGVHEAEPEGYKNWPEDIQPKTPVTYNPDAAPWMIDLPADGLITATPGRGLMLAPADCAPAAIYDTRQKALALAHVGREGAALDIMPKMLRRLRQSHGTIAADVQVHFGASIAPESYVLPYLSPVLEQDAWRDFLREAPGGGFETDVVGYAIQRLVEHGIPAERISRSPVDVATHPDYFSFVAHKQRGALNGRNGFVAAIA